MAFGVGVAMECRVGAQSELLSLPNVPSGRGKEPQREPYKAPESGPSSATGWAPRKQPVAGATGRLGSLGRGTAAAGW